jgi:quinol monooxygenase YgiN
VFEPVVFISHSRIKKGKLETLRKFIATGSKAIKGEKPGTVGFLAYANDDGTEVTIVHVFPDSAAMDRHLEGADERSEAAYEFLETKGFEIYGKISDPVLAAMQRFSRSGVELRVDPDGLGGYLRLGGGAKAR